MTPMELAQAKRAERKKIIDQMHALVPNDGSAMSMEAVAKHTEMDTAQENLLKEITRIERQDTLDREINARREHMAIASSKSTDEVTADEKAHRTAFRNWMKLGMNGLPDDQRQIVLGLHTAFSDSDRAQLSVMNSLSGVDLTGGAVLVPTGMGTEIIEAQKAFGGMLDPGVCYQFDTDMGNELPIPTDDDTTNEGEMLGENTETGDGDPKFGATTMRGYIFSSKKVRVPIALLQDSAFNLETYLAKKLGIRLARAKNRKFTVGNGASQPMGAFTAATVGVNLAAGEVASIAYDEILDLKHSVDPAYRKTARFMLNDTSLKVIKKLKDGLGRPLWQSGIATKEPDMIDGDPFTINQHAPDMAASAASIAYGDFSLYYIRNVGGTLLMRLNERYAEKFQVAFLAFQRADGQLIDAGTHPIKTAKHPAN